MYLRINGIMQLGKKTGKGKKKQKKQSSNI
jgi:hypothetical protein